MPAIDYVCPEGHKFEKITSKWSETAVCPACGQQAQQVISNYQSFRFNWFDNE